MFQPVADHSLFGQLQARFPSSSLITELLQIHEGTFVVRALIQVGGTPIATGMATATSIEQAEDQARLRALSVLGIMLTSVPPLPPSQVPPLPTSQVPPLPQSSLPQSSLPQARLSQPTPPLPTPPLPTSSVPTVPTVSAPYLDLEEGSTQEFFFEEEPKYDFSTSMPESMPDNGNRTPKVVPFTQPELTIQSEKPAKPAKPIKAEKSGKSKTVNTVAEINSLEPGDLEMDNLEGTPATTVPFEAEIPSAGINHSDEAQGQPAIAPVLSPSVTPSPPPSLDEALDEPDDLSSLIAFTDVEMDRVGWTKQKGREHLKQTYRKSTRQKLDVDELMDFLNYLRALPSLNGL